MSLENNSISNAFFSNTEVPYSAKIGAIATMCHGTFQIFPKGSKKSFMATILNNKREVVATIAFDFGNNDSMGQNNCSASMQTLVEKHGLTENLYKNLIDGQMPSDEQIIEDIVRANAEKFSISNDGLVEDFERNINGKLDNFFKVLRENENASLYPDSMTNGLKSIYKEKASEHGKKKQQTVMAEA